MIVADTNLIVYLLIPGEGTANARAVFGKDPDWCAPLLWRSEFRNTLSMFLRRGKISLVEAEGVTGDADRLMRGHAFQVGTRRVLELSLASGCTAYDCEFVALAETLGVSLVTSDREVLKAFPAIAVSLETFAGGSG